MAKTAEKTDRKLWDKVKADVTKANKGGQPGQWSARKAQIATHEYKKAGGGYKGVKSPDNHLTRWTNEDWGTKSGAESGETGERYLPRKAREHLSVAEYRRTTNKKRADTEKGRQFSPQPKDLGYQDRPRPSDRPQRHSGGSAKASGSKGHCGTLDDTGPAFGDGVIMFKGAVHHRASNLEHQVRAARRPTHLLLGIHPAM